jgi:arsenite-transporting ATPase
VFPSEDADDWRRRWVAAQADVLAEVESSFTGLPVWRSSYQVSEPVGVAALVEFARAAYDGDDALVPPTGEPPMRVARTRAGAVLHIALPFVAKSDIDLARHGDELVVTVGSYRRVIALPAALGRHAVAGARIDDGELQVRFTSVDVSAAPGDRPSSSGKGTGERAGGDR